MKKKKVPFILNVMLLIVVFGAGYYAGSRSEHILPPTKENARKAIQTLWVKADQPPMPRVTIDGIEIKLQRSGYSWCNGDQCSMTDAARPELKDMTPVVVRGGADVKTTPPEGIDGFNIQNLTLSSIDGYTVPTDPGSYLYEINCNWPLDQGHASFYFAVTVN